MSEFHFAANRDELRTGECKAVSIGPHTVALCNVNGEFYAMDNTCPHRGGPLGDGTLAGPVITCPWHGWQFDVMTGQNRANAGCSIRLFETRTTGDAVEVRIQ